MMTRMLENIARRMMMISVIDFKIKSMVCCKVGASEGMDSVSVDMFEG